MIATLAVHLANLTPANAGTSFEHAANGSLLLAIPVAVIAGLVSFLSPCVLPLVPAYLSYVTGMSAADLAAAPAVSDGPGAAVAVEALKAAQGKPTARRRGRVLLGSVLFVAGFSAVFVSFGALFGATGAQLVGHAVVVDRIAGAVAVVMGLAFMGWIPGLQRELRFTKLPSIGIAGAPILGVAFGVGWTPCVGPTLGVVGALAADPTSNATAARGALLTVFYCAGLGVPFIASGLLFRRALGAFEIVKRHYAWVVRGGGVLLIAVGVLLITGEWTTLSIDLRNAIGTTYTPPV